MAEHGRQLYSEYIEYLKGRDNSRYLESKRKYFKCKFCKYLPKRPKFRYEKPLDPRTGLPPLHHQKVCQACADFWSRHRFRLTPEIRKRLILQGNNHCNICGVCKRPHKDLDIDHCHRTNHVRGHLCIKCNVGLGTQGYNENIDLMLRDIDHLMNGHFYRVSHAAVRYFRNSANTLEKAIAYLRIHNLLSSANNSM